MKQIITLAVIIFLLAIIVNLVFSILSLWSKRDVLTQARQEVVAEQQQHVKLQQQLNQVNSPSFIEEQARDKLFLVKPGETLVIFPTASPSASPVQEDVSSQPTWQQWWSIFF